MAYITLFPIGTTMRANLFGYRDLHDPWLKQFRDAPRETLYAMWPGLRPLMGDFTVTDFVKIRPVDLFVTKGQLPGRRRAGRRRVRDVVPSRRHRRAQGAGRCRTALQRAYPALAHDTGHGRGENRRVLRRPGETGACDAYSTAKAYGLRSFTLDTSPAGVARRWIKFVLHWGKGFVRSIVAPQPAIEMPHDDEHAPTLARSNSVQK